MRKTSRLSCGAEIERLFQFYREVESIYRNSMALNDSLKCSRDVNLNPLPPNSLTLEQFIFNLKNQNESNENEISTKYNEAP